MLQLVCLMGVKQGCLLSPTLFGLYVDGLEKHLLETADIDAPTLRAVLVSLLLYADDLMLMSTSAAGLQKQLDALVSFCDELQLTVNLSKTKIVVFEPHRSEVADFVLNGVVVEGGELQIPRLCLPCHQEHVCWNKLLGGSC